eukprot:4087154-Alexandrium_andersonii.AAC.1
MAARRSHRSRSGFCARHHQRPLNEAADLVMSGIAVLLTDVARGLRAYGAPCDARVHGLRPRREFHGSVRVQPRGQR